MIALVVAVGVLNQLGNSMKSWIVFSILALQLTACRSADETRRGEVDEFCNGAENDCRAGLSCLDGVCTDSVGQTEYSCGDFCARLTECGAGEDSCVADCRVTIRDWGFDAQDAFTRCGATELTCDEIAATFAPQECYSRIPIAAERQDVCDQFAQTVENCGGSSANLATACAGFARVSDDETWSQTQTCVNAVAVGICSGIATCLNSVFELDPALVLDDVTIDEPQPEVRR